MLRAGVVAGRQAPRLLATRTASSSCVTAGRQEARRGRRRRARRDPRLRLVARRPVARLLPDRPQRQPLALRLERGRRPGSAASPTSSSTSTRPAWDPEGKYLYFLSDREFAPQISRSSGTTPATARPGSSPWPCSKDVPSPFPPQSDEVTSTARRRTTADEGRRTTRRATRPRTSKAKDEKPETARWSRSTSTASPPASPGVPVEADNIDGLAVAKGYLLYVKAGARLLRPRQRREAGAARSST